MVVKVEERVEACNVLVELNAAGGGHALVVLKVSVDSVEPRVDLCLQQILVGRQLETGDGSRA